MTATKITSAGNHLLREIAAGRDRVFYMSNMPNGWPAVERAGLAARDPQDENRAVLTLKGYDHVAALEAKETASRIQFFDEVASS